MENPNANSIKKLLQKSSSSGKFDSLYSLLTTLIVKLSKEPETTEIDVEDYIRDLIDDEFKPDSSISSSLNRVQEENVKESLDFIKTVEEERRHKRRDGVRMLCEDFVHFGHAGVNLFDTEIYQLDMEVERFFLSRNSSSSSKKKTKNAKNAVTEIRFFGKVEGTDRDYYVVETNWVPIKRRDYRACGQEKLRKFDVKVDGLVNQSEKGGDGANKYCYWVCNKLGDEWVRLPDVSASQIVLAKRIRKLVTGDLKKTVESFPKFPWTEANYLRAQIARIAAGTTIAPMGVMIKPEDPEEESEEEGEDEDDEEGKGKKEKEEKKPDLIMNPQYGKGDDENGEGEALTTKQLQKLDNWVHIRNNLLKTGRVTRYVPPKVKREGEDEESEEEPEEDDDEEENPNLEKVKDLLESINGDDKISGSSYIRKEKEEKKKKKEGEEEGEGEDSEDSEEDEEEEGEDGEKKEKIEKFASWKIQAFNDIEKKFATILVKSLRWPGAYTYCLAKDPRKFSTIYIGDGLKYEGELGVFTPYIPPQIMQEDVDLAHLKDATPGEEKKLLIGEKIDDEEGEDDDEDD